MSDYAPLVDITVSRNDIDQCKYSNWYELFKSLTPQSKIIKPLPPAFIQYLKQDGIKLAEEHGSYYNEDLSKNEENEYSDWENEESDSDSEADNNSNKKSKIEKKQVDPIVDFPDLHNQIKEIIANYGSVTPKLNWSSPRDATWILANNTTKCSEINDLYLLLNASNYITHDLEHAYDNCIDVDETNRNKDIEFELVLRQWFNINPALEFRVFVKNGEIIGVSQRDLNYYDYLETLSDTFKDAIDEFVEDKILPKFTLKSFVLDVYIPRPFDKVFLIDINPFARKTDPLMFSWSELETLHKLSSQKDDYELRLLTETNVGRFAHKEHSENQVPIDIVEASLNPDAIKELADKWSELLKKQDDYDSDSHDN
ncbi:hypothetical protein TPHA_0A03030 [Tetrapisispora phaffii CBS 4417]|uniref:Translation initiation factor eIF2 assembly protein n=1 Tax=Tetrapisispora phaffii (strain ATCC 24235 / CBS 4417 / NBRC 1672 / NRRL Y-8282 / UCD 70-5) TaxID=1071381 RepID=G8BNA3_TETPH|nr:hypothetical protein TPHA_0A03030 [Tetrapisispora phaffii CBS 4417]CCE61381.1 hypothetical protein TPHA_0A03030 [Tetrapisispora phaffii CBS 4417]